MTDMTDNRVDTEFGARERALLDAFRDHHAMPAEARARVWAGLAGPMGGPGGGSEGGGSAIESASEAWLAPTRVAAARGWSRPALVAGAGLVLAAGLTLLVLGSKTGEAIDGVSADASAPAAIEPVAIDPTSKVAEPSSLAPSSPPRIAAPVLEPIEPAVNAAKPITTTPRPRARVLDSTQASSLGRERALIERAHAALAKAESEAALAALDEHAREFPQGVFAEEREALDAIARCKGGQLELGRAHARAFLDQHPRAVLAGRVRRACLIEGSASELP